MLLFRFWLHVLSIKELTVYIDKCYLTLANVYPQIVSFKGLPQESLYFFLPESRRIASRYNIRQYRGFMCTSSDVMCDF